MQFTRILCTAFLAAWLLAACGKDEASTPSPPASPAPAPAPAPAPVGTPVGAAGGTVTGPLGTQVAIPPGALANEIRIHIEQTSAGAPPAPGGFALSGAMFAFTPHGTTFAVPATITLPFDPSTIPPGHVPVLYKTNGQNQFVAIAYARFGPSSVSAEISGFSLTQVVIEPLTPDQLLRTVDFDPVDGLNEQLEDDDGVLDERRLVGPAGLFEIPFDGDETSALEAFSSANAIPFWVASESGKGRVMLRLDRSFVKETDDATLEIVVSVALAEAVDLNGPPTFDECPYGPSLSTCTLIYSHVGFAAELTRATPDGEDFVYLPDEEFPDEEGSTPVLDTGSLIRLEGHGGLWGLSVGDDGLATTSVFNDQNIGQTDDINGDPAKSHPRMRTHAPIVIPVDLSQVRRFERFWINTTLSASTRNERRRESGVGAYIRDPVKVGGSEMRFTGLRPSAAPRPTPRVPRKSFGCSSPAADPQAGQLQFRATSYQLHEGRTTEENGVIEVERIGGTRGDVSATLSIAGGSATAGVHYVPLVRTVIFGDGDAGPKLVGMETTQNEIGEPARTVVATLSAPGGCAALGERVSTTVTILDDELTPQPPTRFTVGGTVVGLRPATGTNLVLENHTGLFLEIVADGPFTFTDLPSAAGSSYFVRVFNQPRNALGNQTQSCSVANGTGIFGNANVTNVLVTCVDL